MPNGQPIVTLKLTLDEANIVRDALQEMEPRNNERSMDEAATAQTLRTNILHMLGTLPT